MLGKCIPCIRYILITGYFLFKIFHLFFYHLSFVDYVYNIYIAFIMAKETVSFKLEKDYRVALEKEARKKEWTLSYFIQSIVNQHVKKNKLV